MPDGTSDDIHNLSERFKRARDSRLFAPLADAYRKNGEIDKAVELLERGLEKYPDYASARVILGKCYYDKGATERAKAEFIRVIELDSENMVALKFMGEILLSEGRYAEAAEYFRKVVAIDPKNQEVLKMLGDAEKGIPVKEIDLADRAAVRDERPRDLATMTLAGIYAAQGYYSKALKIYREVLEREPGNREALEMVDKLQLVMDSSDEERRKAFEEGVLTISVDDISEDVAASTAGHGGAEPPVEHPETIAAADREAAAGISEDAQPPAEEREPETSTPPRDDSLAGERGPTTARQAGDLEHFRQWVSRLKKK